MHEVHIEEELGHTRQCLELIERYGFDVERCFSYLHEFEEKETFEQMSLF